MTPQDAVKLCKFAKSACPQQAIDQETPDAWFVLLHDLRFEDAMQALVAVTQTQPFVSPSEIRAQVKKIRAARVTAFGHLPDPPAEVGADVAKYRAWQAECTRRIADGEVTRPDQLPRDLRPTKPRAELEGRLATAFEGPIAIPLPGGEDD